MNYWEDESPCNDCNNNHKKSDEKPCCTCIQWVDGYLEPTNHESKKDL